MYQLSFLLNPAVHRIMRKFASSTFDLSMTTENHRTRVAAEKRERMRQRLIESALLVFSRKGADSAVIEDVILMAEVSRGTFYNYFKTNEELMVAVLDAVGRELIASVDAAVSTRSDPAERVACGLRLVLHTSRRFPMFARFLARVGMQQAIGTNPVIGFLTRDISNGMKAGRFELANEAAGLAMALGVTQAAIIAMSLDEVLSPEFPEQIAYHLLLGFGMTKASARRIGNLPIERVSIVPDSLLARSQKREETSTI
jgi:AcrR family transcriptional regulator